MLNHELPLGWFLRAMHGWGSNFMVAVVLIHMAQVFLFGAYKFPRELTWIVGVFMLLMTLGMAFTGQVLRFDQDAYWGLGDRCFDRGARAIDRRELVHLMLGGPMINGATLTRFFALHVFVIPGTLLVLYGPARVDGAEAGHQRVADAGAHRSARDVHRGIQRTGAQRRDSVCAGGGVEGPVLLRGDSVWPWRVCAAVFGPYGPKGVAGPNDHQHGAEAGLFLLVDLYGAFVSAGGAGDAFHTNCAGGRGSEF